VLRAAAAEWLTNYLAAAAGPVQSGKIMEDAKQFGMALKTLRRAADEMAIVKCPPGGGRNCTWDLPDEIKDLMGVPTGDHHSSLEDQPEGPYMEDGRFFSDPEALMQAELDAANGGPVDWDTGLADLLHGDNTPDGGEGQDA
jgi:hypothetical protein